MSLIDGSPPPAAEAATAPAAVGDVNAVAGAGWCPCGAGCAPDKYGCVCKTCKWDCRATGSGPECQNCAIVGCSECVSAAECGFVQCLGCKADSCMCPTCVANRCPCGDECEINPGLCSKCKYPCRSPETGKPGSEKVCGNCGIGGCADCVKEADCGHV
jgi:hypothetical protein